MLEIYLAFWKFEPQYAYKKMFNVGPFLPHPSSDRRYSPTEKELLVVFYTVKKEEVYIKGHSFVWYTDHKPLTLMGSIVITLVCLSIRLSIRL